MASEGVGVSVLIRHNLAIFNAYSYHQLTIIFHSNGTRTMYAMAGFGDWFGLVWLGSSSLNAAGNSFFHSFAHSLSIHFTYIFLWMSSFFGHRRIQTQTHAHLSSTELCVMYEHVSVESVLFCLSVCRCVCVRLFTFVCQSITKLPKNLLDVLRIESGISPITMPLRCGVTSMSFTAHTHTRARVSKRTDAYTDGVYFI